MEPLFVLRTRYFIQGGLLHFPPILKNPPRRKAMTELQVAKRVISELQKQFIKVKVENEYLRDNIKESEFEKYNKIGSNPQKFGDRELAQIIHTLVKLTNDYELSPHDMAVMINADLSDVFRVYNKIDNLFEKTV